MTGERAGPSTPAPAEPRPGLRAVVVVPARDEEALITRCLAALAAQEEVPHEAYEILLVLDACVDETELRARRFAGERACPPLHLLPGPGAGSGAARRVGMELASARLHAAGRPEGLIASTDADSVVGPTWLRRQLDYAAAGARAIGGLIELGDDGSGLPAEGVVRDRDRSLRRRRRQVLESTGEDAEHGFFSGASLAVTAEAYASVGGLEPLTALEDEALERALQAAGVPILRPDSVRVATSPRTGGRAARGLSRDLRLADWHARRTFRAEDFTLEDLLARSDRSVAAVVPCEAAEVDRLAHALSPLVGAGLLDEVLLVTGAPAPRREGAPGVRVRAAGELVPGIRGPSRGPGDVLWRSLRATSSEALLLLDARAPETLERRALGMIGALAGGPGALLALAFGEPPGDAAAELAVAAATNLLAPDLAALAETLRPELAVSRALLATVSVAAGEATPLALAIDALARGGLDALAQVHCPSLPETAPQARSGARAYAALTAAARRLLPGDAADALVPGALVRATGSGIEREAVVLEERPPHR